MRNSLCAAGGAAARRAALRAAAQRRGARRAHRQPDSRPAKGAKHTTASGVHQYQRRVRRLRRPRRRRARAAASADRSRAPARRCRATVARLGHVRSGVGVMILRVPGIYAADRLPLERIRAGTPALADAEDSYTNHIHADDLARIVARRARARPRPARLQRLATDSWLKMGEYFDLVAERFGLPRAPRISRQEAEERVARGAACRSCGNRAGWPTDACARNCACGCVIPRWPRAWPARSVPGTGTPGQPPL